MLIPRAHAASITGVVILSVRQNVANETTSSATDEITSVRVLSAGADQRIKVWNVVVPLTKPTIDTLQVRRVSKGWTCVTDVSDIALISKRIDDSEGRDDHGSEKETETRVLIVGVGMEVLRLTEDGVQSCHAAARRHEPGLKFA